MRCPLQSKDGSAILLDYCANKLLGEEATAVERHIQECQACSAFAKSQKGVWSVLDAWEPAEISPAFTANLYARIDEEQQRNWFARLWGRLIAWESGSSFGWRPAMPVAAACLTIVLGLFLYRPQPLSTPAPQPGQQVMKASDKVPVDVDQVETALDDMDMLRQLSSPSSSPKTM